MDMKKLNERFINSKKAIIKLENAILRNPEIDATDLDGEVVMMNIEKGQYFMMNDVGSRHTFGASSEVKLIIEGIVGVLDL